MIKAGRLIDVATGATVIDLSHKTVRPGLIDTHTHVTGDPTLPPYYGYGISVPREALGIEADVGQIAPGYSADIVAVTRDPLSDIHSMDDVEFVMKQGTVYKQ